MTLGNRFFHEYEKLRDSNLLFESMLIYCDRNTYESCISFLVFRFYSLFCDFALRYFIKGINKWHEGRSYEVEFYFEDELKLEFYFENELKYDPFNIRKDPYREDSYSLEAVLTNSTWRMEEKIIKNILDRYVEQKS